MRTVLQCLAFVCVIGTATAGESPVANQLRSTDPAVSRTAFKRVLSDAEHMSAMVLYLAAAEGLKSGQLSEAGFLFYAARIRGVFDQALFPPTGTGGNSPQVLLGALQQQIGLSLNPALMSDPKAYAAAVGRVKAWNPSAPENYDPGWEHKGRTTLELAERAIREMRQKFIEQMVGMSTLLNDPDDFAATRVVQKYNLATASPRPTKADYDAAITTMAEIEKSKGIPGPGSRLKK